VFVHNALTGAGLRDRVRVIYSGKVLTGFHMIRAFALGADTCNSARAMMFALGCIQALRCNNNTCPTGITTQNPALVKGLNVPDKTERVYRFHRATIHAMLEMLAAMGLKAPADVEPEHVNRRIDDLNSRSLAELYDFVDDGLFLADERPDLPLIREWDRAAADRWTLVPERGEPMETG
jgi:glutamate synthase domain-containing protein 2